MVRLFFFALSFCCITLFAQAQKPIIQIVDTSHKTSIRGLSVVNDKIIWCSGNNGAVAKSVDGGKTFLWMRVAGFEKRDFRDIEAFDEKTALIMGIEEPAIILKTIDGGATWTTVLIDSTKGMFLDAMHFDTKGNGIVIGDPINNHPYIAVSTDYGSSWQQYKGVPSFKTAAGEAFFASSGTNIHFTNHEKNKGFITVTGGIKSRLFHSNNPKKLIDLPLLQGKESTGANAIAIWKKNAVVVGGDFANDKDTTGNCTLIHLGKAITFTHPQKAPNGYKSCVVFIHKNTLVTCGTSGVDISYDGGLNWQCISTQSFHVVQKAKKGNAIYLAGSKGKIAQLML